MRRKFKEIIDAQRRNENIFELYLLGGHIIYFGREDASKIKLYRKHLFYKADDDSNNFISYDSIVKLRIL